MPPHSKVIGRFLYFQRLDRSNALSGALCLGYRFTDEGEELWTRFVNRFKEKEPVAVQRASQILAESVGLLSFMRRPVVVVPVLPSGATSAAADHPVTLLAAAIAKLSGFVPAMNLLSKRIHRPLHGIYDADTRDAEVGGAYAARRFPDIGITAVGTVILVDDMCTRGATFNDAARAIRAANGSRAVYGVALAKTERKSYWNGAIDNGHLDPALKRVARL